MREHAVDVDEDGAGIHAERAGGRVGLEARGGVDLAVMRDEEAQVVAELVGEFEVVGVKIRVVAIVGAAPVLAVRKHTVGNRGEWVADGVLRIGAGGDRGAGENGGIAKCGRGGRLHIIERAAEIEVDVGIAGGGDAAHADAVDLHAGGDGIGVGGVGAGAAEVGLEAVVEMERALIIARLAAFVVGVEPGAAVFERLPPQRAGVTAKITGAALAELFHLGVEGVEAQAEAREQRLVDVDRVALRAEGIHAHGGAGAAAKGGAFGRDVNDAGGINVAIGEAAGAARELDALGISRCRRGGTTGSRRGAGGSTGCREN